MNTLYKEIITAKSNEKIPLFENGKSMHSKYSPVREAESFGSEIKSGGNYTIILGLRSEERRVGKECRSRWSPYH